jgi:fatty aldehyde decarbonylase
MDKTSLLNTSVAPPLSEMESSVWRDILAQAVTGEMIGSLNYATLADLYAQEDERQEALKHSADERAHAARFSAVAQDLNLAVSGDTTAPYWKRIGLAFLSRASGGDLIACIVAQEVMLESFAVATYELIGQVAPGKLGSIFSTIAREEGEHVVHAVSTLQVERNRDPQAFDQKVREVHEEVMTTLAEMVAREDHNGHCGLCSGSCAKPSLSKVGLSTAALRGVSLRRYLKTLDAIGVPGKASLAWVARLPV